MTILSVEGEVPGAVLDFLDRVISPRGRAHWCWKYRDGAPGAPAGFYWQESDGRVLGFVGLMRTSLHAGGHSHPAAWFVDWHAVPGERSVGIGLGLLRRAEVSAGLLLTLQGSADTRRILPNLGWHESLPGATWVRPLGPRFLAARLARHLPAPFVRVAAALAMSYWRVARPGREIEGALHAVERFPDDYEAVWRERAGELGATMARGPAYLNRWCADFPGGGYRLALLRRGEEIVGHLVTRVDPAAGGLRRGRIVDLLWPGREPGLADPLLGAACHHLREWGADYVECTASTPELGGALRRARFRVRGPVSLWYHRLPDGVPSPEGWHLTYLDCDRAYR